MGTRCSRMIPYTLNYFYFYSLFFRLGISIVGGRQEEDDQKLQGIFIKHVLESSPAGQTGLLKTGDQILEVHIL